MEYASRVMRDPNASFTLEAESYREAVLLMDRIKHCVEVGLKGTTDGDHKD